MKERLILNESCSLKGWKKVPYAIYSTEMRKAVFLNKDEFEFVLRCSGKQEIDTDKLDNSLQDF